MPTTQPLDDDILGEIFEGPFKPIAGFARTDSQPSGQQPRANVTVPSRSAINPLRNQRRPPLRTPDLRLNGTPLKEKSAPVSATKTESSQRVFRSETYTPDKLNAAWEAFIEENSHEHLLGHAMRASVPRNMPDSPHHYVIAQSKSHLEYINRNLDHLTDYIRNYLKNDSVTFILHEVSEDSPEVWTDRELLRNMIEKNTELADFITALRLNLL